jgi:L-ascorbate peroxidase
MGLEAEEYVALMGSFTIGFANDENKTRNGRWTMNPYVFDNTYFQEILLGENGKYLKTEADLKLLHDPELKQWVEKYAADQNLFFENYAKAHIKVSEMGQEEHLLSEFNEDEIVNGGYMERKGKNHWSEKFKNCFSS